MTPKLLRTSGLPFSLLTTTYGLLVMGDANNEDLFTYCPHLGVMRGLGDFDDNMRMYTPKYSQVFVAPVDELLRMKRDWHNAALTNDRYGLRSRSQCPADAPLPFIAKLSEPEYVDQTCDEMKSFNECCTIVESDDTPDDDDDGGAAAA